MQGGKLGYSLTGTLRVTLKAVVGPVAWGEPGYVGRWRGVVQMEAPPAPERTQCLPGTPASTSGAGGGSADTVSGPEPTPGTCTWAMARGHQGTWHKQRQAEARGGTRLGSTGQGRGRARGAGTGRLGGLSSSSICRVPAWCWALCWVHVCSWVAGEWGGAPSGSGGHLRLRKGHHGSLAWGLSTKGCLEPLEAPAVCRPVSCSK